MRIKKAERKIQVYPKHTNASTTYYEMQQDDEWHLYRWLQRLLADMTEIATYDEEVRREWFKRRPGLYPKGEHGPNSHASVLGGIVSAKLQNPKKNLSEAQLDIVQSLFIMVEDYYSDEPEAPVAIIFERTL